MGEGVGQKAGGSTGAGQILESIRELNHGKTEKNNSDQLVGCSPTRERYRNSCNSSCLGQDRSGTRTSDGGGAGGGRGQKAATHPCSLLRASECFCVLNKRHKLHLTSQTNVKPATTTVVDESQISRGSWGTRYTPGSSGPRAPTRIRLPAAAAGCGFPAGGRRRSSGCRPDTASNQRPAKQQSRGNKWAKQEVSHNNGARGWVHWVIVVLCCVGWGGLRGVSLNLNSRENTNCSRSDTARATDFHAGVESSADKYVAGSPSSRCIYIITTGSGLRHSEGMYQAALGPRKNKIL